ncbi:hypothetical protein LJC55_02665 [Eubacteriales bacterium OttesenSCG-928-N14]|nr:hypothetical protein [Eubacteriales bacterium OttesenSCG-928-N14]
MGRSLSASYAPSPSDLQYEEYVLQMEKLFDRYSSSGTLIMQNETRCYVGGV